ncbi:hypothetical protein BDY24DRAFT_402980, partial [Mrakia frigida]|uniref:uncharacterized protein n=1 Tax=Mrakia frigida TaxID=29902 RepID=UPI003FCC1B2F
MCAGFGFLVSGFSCFGLLSVRFGFLSFFTSLPSSLVASLFLAFFFFPSLLSLRISFPRSLFSFTLLARLSPSLPLSFPFVSV